MSESDKRGPMLYVEGHRPHRVEGLKDLKKGDVFSVCGGRKRVMLTDPVKTERGWMAKTGLYEEVPF